MDPIESWLLKKGIALAKSSVMSLLEVKDAQTVMSEKIDGALLRLDRLLDAPYEAARLHLLGRDVDSAIDHLKDAIARRPLNLAARLLHIRLLCLEEKYEEALENYWELMKAFSYREDLVPSFLYQAFIEEVDHTPVRPEKSELLRLREGCGTAADCAPRSVWCSPGAIGIEWLWPSESLFFGRTEKISITLHDWRGKLLLRAVPDSRTAIEMLTSEYVVYRDDDGKLRVFSLLEEKEVAESPLGEATFRALFLPADRELSSTRLYQRTHIGKEELAAGRFRFSNIVSRLGSCVTEEERYDPGLCMDGFSEPSSTYSVPVTWNTVDCIRQPLQRMPSLVRAAESTSVGNHKSDIVEWGIKEGLIQV